MASIKCPQCRLINFADQAVCRRCGAPLLEAGPPDTPLEPAATSSRGLGRRLAWVVGATIALLLAAFVSLVQTSDGLDGEERLVVTRAVALLGQSGFTREAFVFEHLVTFRSRDHWWNQYVGHESAYAATNFPFEIVTLYPNFFTVTADDLERAAILLHESYHLFGKGEEAALQGAWVGKRRLGWTEDRYGETQVWKNTREWTMGSAPTLFMCGSDGHADCVN